MSDKNKDAEQSIKDWYYSCWLFEGCKATMRKEGAEVLKGMRKKAGKTQHEFADDIGVDPTYLSNIENGHERMSVIMVKRLRKYIEERDGESLAESG